MIRTRTSVAHAVLAILLIAAGAWLWIQHARAWDLGRASPVLGYDAAEYAVAARELAAHGRFATPYALPIELARHASPPWPLALVQPGLVVAEAALFRLHPGEAATAPDSGATALPGVAWSVLTLPVFCYFACALLLALATAGILRRHAPGLSTARLALAGGIVALAFLLDPEAQHFATSGFTELPFTLGLLAALCAIAFRHATRRPLLFGLLLGVAGAFRGNMLWLAPVLALAAAAAGPARSRPRIVVLTLVGFALPLVPWWIYKWRSFGTPAWDLSALSVWDGIGGRTWFSLNHLPEMPHLPSGWAAARDILGKVGRNLPIQLLDLSIGPRGLWAAGLLFWALAPGAAPQAPDTPPSATVATSRGTVAAAYAALGALLLSAVVAAASVPLLRYAFPTRVAVEAAGVIGLWGLIAGAPPSTVGPRVQRALVVAVAVLAIGWGCWQTVRGWHEGRSVATSRGVPSDATMVELSRWVDRRVPADEPVMSNLGPVLAWFDRRPVLHLALSPADVDACRRRLAFQNLLLVFQDPSRAWPEWQAVMEHPAEAARHPEWNIERAEPFVTKDGFQAVWLELGPLAPPMAAAR